MSTISNAQEVLQNTFGYGKFRGQQKTIIQTVLEQKDSLVIMPTGGGKSICFQIPAILSTHLTIVVSPLIALMEDQVTAIRELGVKAACLHSNIPVDEKIDINRQIDDGILKLLYVAPETLFAERFLNYITTKTISLFAIDEAHCISVWGNDFRPNYTKLGQLKSLFPETPIIALTATADASTQKDILRQLQIPNAAHFVSSFERDNITIHAREGTNRLGHIKALLKDHKGESGIVYCLSRKGTEGLAEKLNAAGVSAAYYHAGMDALSRNLIQRRFQNDEVKIVCATIAFGMGIDKSNVRFVIHYNMPKNLEGFYQEIGRAGRDGVASQSLLFYSWADVVKLRSFIDDGDSNDQFKAVQHAKLDRMWEFANAASCRTNMILSYFNEYQEEGCGHCDNCISPPQFFQGTELAQKALSAVARTGQQVGINMLIDILRGSMKQEITAGGFHNIKTFGAGRDLPFLDWKSYISQMINRGIISIDFTDHYKLKLTPLSKQTLIGKRKIDLVKFVKQAEKKRPAPKAEIIVNDVLFEKLRSWRLEIAQEKRVPPYIIFSDATLKALSSMKPQSNAELLEVDGIGQVKLERYGNAVLRVIENHEVAEDQLK